MLDPMKVALLKMGTTMPSVKAKYGDYEDWFANALQFEPSDLLVINAIEEAPFPENGQFNGLIISGSSHAVYDREPWSERAGDWIQEQMNTQIPILGVCYGHQLIAQRLGARVDLSPGGREIGVCAVEKVDDDPLFDGLPNVFDVIQTHSDAVLSPVPNARVLAKSPQAENQAMALGSRIRTLQWHPEITAEVIEEYILLRREAIESEFDASHVDRLLTVLKPTSSGQIILRNFIEHFVKPSL